MSNIFIGNKEQKYYISLCLAILGKENEITLLARGKHIIKAINVAEIVKRITKKQSFVEISSSSIKVDNKDRYVSEIKITLK